MKATINIQLEPGEELTTEAKAIQAMQDGLAKAARTTPDELAELWRAGVAELKRNAVAARPRHQHKRKTRGV